MKFSEIPYERAEIESIKEEFSRIMEESAKASSKEEQFEVHKKYYELAGKLMTSYCIAHVRNSIDVTDSYYDEEYKYYNMINPEFANIDTEYKKMLYNSPYKDYLIEKIGEPAFKNIELQMKANDVRLITLMQEENELVTQYNKLIAGAEIEFDNEILNLSMLRKYLVNNDRSVRERAYKKRSEFFLSIEKDLDDIFDKLVHNRTAQARELGYDNYIELGYCRMNRNCYDKDMVKVFREQVKEHVVPLVSRIHEGRQKVLGLDKMTFIDEGIFFTNGNPEPIGTPEEILEAGKKMYGELSEETKEFFDFMMENELFDVLSRKNKRAGGYEIYIPGYKSPFIFANFNGTSGDIDVITHECGHAFQAYTARELPIAEHRDITSETAEIHSMAMEFFTEPWMNLFFGGRTEDYVQMHLKESLIFLPYGCMVDEFQHLVYENPAYSPSKRKEIWMELEKQYRPGLDYDNDLFFGKGGRWQNQLHIYNYPFYYIDYCLAMTCALQFKASMEDDYKGAWDRYLKLCKASASGFFVDMIKDAGIKSPFEEGTLKWILDKIEDEIKLHN